MSIALESLVDPEAYDGLIYEALHSVVDRTIELASKADIAQADTEPDIEGEESSADFVNIIRSQANFTPSELAEFQTTGTLLNVLIGVSVARRSSLYHDTNLTEAT